MSEVISDKAGPSEKCLVIGVSSRALFNLDKSHQVYEKQGLRAYQKFQIRRENKPLKPGGGYHLVRKLLNINKKLGENRVEVVLLSRNTAGYRSESFQLHRGE